MFQSSCVISFLIISSISHVCFGQDQDQDDVEIDRFDIFQSRSLPNDSEYIADYWTRERLLGARPIEELKPSLIGNQSNDEDRLRILPEINDIPDIIEGTTADETPETRVLTSGQLVVKTVGKVFFSSSSGAATCSASVVVAPSKSLLVTAAHCVYDLDTRTWYTRNWVFIPAYDYGGAPFGRWSAKSFTALRAYTQSSRWSPNYNYDVAFVVLWRNNNRKIADVTGSQGIIFNPRRNQPVLSFGYPGNIANAYIMSSCVNKEIPPPCRSSSSYIGQGLRCGMTQGCSGGPWIQRFNSLNGLGYITSVNSYGCSQTPYMMHGPYFNSNIRLLYNSVKNRV